MKLIRGFPNLRFPETVLRNALKAVDALSSCPEAAKPEFLYLHARGETWVLDTLEEFFGLLPTSPVAKLTYSVPHRDKGRNCVLEYGLSLSGSEIEVSSHQASEIHSVMNVFQESLALATPILSPAAESESESPPSISGDEAFTGEFEEERSTPKIFIGHGRSRVWEELKNHLQDKHEYKVIAFETGVRAGHQIRDILEDMLDQSSMAFMVLTGEDQGPETQIRARQNVVHETGLFQGRLGFSKAIVLLEEGVEEFSNLNGIQHISFSKGNIRECFGDVLAVIRREFS